MHLILAFRFSAWVTSLKFVQGQTEDQKCHKIVSKKNKNNLNNIILTFCMYIVCDLKIPDYKRIYVLIYG